MEEHPCKVKEEDDEHGCLPSDRSPESDPEIQEKFICNVLVLLESQSSVSQIVLLSHREMVFVIVDFS